MLNRVVSYEFSRAIIIVYTQEYPITLHMVRTGQLSRFKDYVVNVINPEDCMELVCKWVLLCSG